MSEIKLTAAQAQAVNSRGRSILVAAAAGSGKTRVITQRLMSYITDPAQPKDVDSFLIITYTRAAAAELRGRVLEEISLLCAQEPENRSLRRQSNLCYRAPIGTIHSYCTAILRENCHKLGLSPDFRVGDEDKCQELRERALAKVFDSAYEHMDEREGFYTLACGIGTGRDDSRLAQTVLDLHSKMQSHPYPEQWAQQQAQRSEHFDASDVGETIWGKLLMDNASATVSYWNQTFEGLWSYIISDPEENKDIFSAYGDSLCQTMEELRGLQRELSISWDRARAQFPINFPRLGPLRNEKNSGSKAIVTEARNACKKDMQSLAAAFSADSHSLLSDLAAAAAPTKALLQLTVDFDRAYTAEKQRYNLLDFSDLEHYAIRLLRDEETGLPTATALELSRRYTEIMVDEYQDVNAVQELIFQSISKNGSNIFMVGDVKQSIYRFRLADPGIFIEKYKSYHDLEQAPDGAPARILLQQNFRSDPKILDACNHIFKSLMSEELGDIDYDDHCALYPPDDASDGIGTVQFKMVIAPETQEGEERPDKLLLEASSVARDIKQLVENGETIVENGVSRPLNYGDIAILLRSPNAVGGTFRQALSALGIPVMSQQGGSFFASPLVQILIAFLKVIDNPHSDIPLTAVLSSPLFDFTPDELSEIRTEDLHRDLFTALEKHSPKCQKCRDFLTLLVELRSLSEDLGVHRLLCLIYDRLELGALCAASQYGDSGATDLMLLAKLAAKFESGGYMGLYSFIKHLTRMQERGDDPGSGGAVSGGAVTIMSIHKSKGLEFPVVFLAATGKRFNVTDLNRPVLVHPSLGLGIKITDTQRGIEYPTIAHSAIRTKLRAEMLSEEMRVLYVALTRAKQRLYISCTGSGSKDLAANSDLTVSEKINPEPLKRSQSPSQWLMFAYTSNADSPISLVYEEGYAENVTNPAESDYNVSGEQLEATLINPTAFSQLTRLLSFRYPHENVVSLPSKLTATLLPDDDGEGQPLLKEETLFFRLPELSGGERPLTGAEKGVATHLLMQYIDFSCTGSPEQISDEVKRLLSLGLLNERQAKAVDITAVSRFFASPAGKRILSADEVLREFRFSLLCPSERFFPNAPGENIMLQGVVDCCLEEDGALTVVDYKTDYVTNDNLALVTEGYKKQLESYAYAMEKITGKSVKSCLLCFLRSGITVEL